MFLNGQLTAAIKLKNAFFNADLSESVVAVTDHRFALVIWRTQNPANSDFELLQLITVEEKPCEIRNT